MVLLSGDECWRKAERNIMTCEAFCENLATSTSGTSTRTSKRVDAGGEVKKRNMLKDKMRHLILKPLAPLCLPKPCSEDDERYFCHTGKALEESLKRNGGLLENVSDSLSLLLQKKKEERRKDYFYDENPFGAEDIQILGDMRVGRPAGKDLSFFLESGRRVPAQLSSREKMLELEQKLLLSK